MGEYSIAHSKNNLNGSRYGDGSYKCYSNFGECIDAFARLIRNHYVQPGQDCYHETSVGSINVDYCPESDAPGNHWATNVKNIANQLLDRCGAY